MSAAATTSPTHPMPTRVPSLRSLESTDASPSAAECPRHRRGSPYMRNTDGTYASSVPACTGGDTCLLGRCDRMRHVLTHTPTRDVLVLYRDRLQRVMDAAPVDTAIPAEALRVRDMANAAIALCDAYQTWQDSGEDTPHTREPLELALRAAEATHDAYTSSTGIYDRVCTRLGRSRVLVGGTESVSVSSSDSDTDTDTDTQEEMTG